MPILSLVVIANLRTFL